MITAGKSLIQFSYLVYLSNSNYYAMSHELSINGLDLGTLVGSKLNRHFKRLSLSSETGMPRGVLILSVQTSACVTLSQVRDQALGDCVEHETLAQYFAGF